MNGKPYTDQERAFVAEHYAHMTAKAIGERLGRTASSVAYMAQRLGLRKQPRYRNAKREETLRRLHAKGYTDTEIGGRLGMTRESTRDWRQSLGLAHNAYSERRCRAVAKKTAEQCREAGVSNLGELRAKVLKERSAKAGWPDDLPWRAGQILTLLWERGPMTRKQIVAALRPDLAGQLTRTVMNRALGDNDAHNGRRRPNSYLATLMRRGLVISLGRIVQSGGRGKNVHLYSLPLTLERGPQEPNRE